MANSKTFHVFLSHNSNDKPAVEEIAHRLRACGLEPWLDKWNLVPGDAWQPALEDALRDSATCVVFVGPSGLGAWQNEEMRAAINRRVSSQQKEERFRVIPVLLPGAVRGDRSQLPEFLTAATWVEFFRTLDDEPAFRTLERAIRGLPPGPGQSVTITECPYRGLEYFDVRHSPIFFGRAAVTDWLLSALRGTLSAQGPTRFLAIIGASGSGKSSLARAGLLAALKDGGIEGSEQWLTTICRPGSSPLESLSDALAKTDGIHLGQGLAANLIEQLKNALQARSNTLHLTARSSLSDAHPARRLVVLVDQFEELFTVCRDDDERQAFIANLLYAARVVQGQVIILLTMRADFYGKCASHSELSAAISEHQFLVGPLTSNELREAIESPARLAGCEFEPGLGELLVDEVQRQPGALPLLQYGLFRMWNNRTGRRITTDDYRAVGELRGIIEKRAEEVFKEFTPSQQELCRRLFLRLTEPGEGTEDTKRRVPWRELTSSQSDGAGMTAIVKCLADERLLTTGGITGPAVDSVVEVAHETLIRRWQRLRDWIESDRAGLRIHRRLTEAAEEWLKNNRDPDFLDYGTRLTLATDWADKHPIELSDSERLFLSAGLAKREFSKSQEREAERDKLRQQEALAQAESDRARIADEKAAQAQTNAAKQRGLKQIAFIVASAAAIAAGIAAWQYRVASKAVDKADNANDTLIRTIAERDDEIRTQRIASLGTLASHARSQIDTCPQRALLLAVEAARGMNQIDDAPFEYVESVLRRALATIGGHGLGSHFALPTEFAYSPDGHWLATAGPNNTAILSDLTTTDPWNNQHILKGHSAQITCLAFSHDGRWLVTACQNRSIRRWDIANMPVAPSVLLLQRLDNNNSHRRPRDISESSSSANQSDRAIQRLQFLRTGHWLGADHDGAWTMLRLKDDTIDNSIRISGHSLPVSPDGRWLLAADTTNVLRLYDLDIGAELQLPITLAIPENSSFTEDPEFSPNSEWLIANNHAAVWLWKLKDIKDASSPITLGHLQHKTFGNHFCPSDEWLITEDFAEGARLWNLQDQDPSTSFQPLGLTDVDSDGNAQSPPNAITSIDFIGTSTVALHRRLAQTVEVLSLGNGRPPSVEHRFIIDDNLPRRMHINSTTLVLTGQRDALVCDLATSPDANKATKYQRPAAKPPIAPAQAERGWRIRNNLIVNFDGNLNYEVWVWRLHHDKSEATTTVLKGHDYEVLSSDISPDGAWMTTLDKNGTARLWNLASDSHVMYPKVIAAPMGVEISPSGDWLFVHKETEDELYDLSSSDSSLAPLSVPRSNKFIAMSDDGHVLISYVNDTDETVVWDLKDRGSQRAVKLHGLRELVSGRHFLGRPSYLYAGSDSRISRDGRWLVIRRDKKRVLIWDLAHDTQPIMPTEMGDDGQELLGPEMGWLFSRVGDSWRSVDQPQKWVRMSRMNEVDAAARRLEVEVSRNPFRCSIACTPDSRWLVAQGKENGLLLFDLHKKDPVASPIRLSGTFESYVHMMCFSPDGKWLIAKGLTDVTAKMWNLHLASASQEPIVVPAHGAASFVFSSDSRWMVRLDGDITRHVGVRNLGLGGQSRLYRMGENGLEADGIEIDRPGYFAGSACFARDDSRLYVLDTNGKAYFIDLGTVEARLRYYDIPRLFSEDGASGAWINVNWYTIRCSGAQNISDSCFELHTLGIRDVITRDELLSDLASRNLSALEWDEFFPGQKYRRTFDKLPDGRNVKKIR